MNKDSKEKDKHLIAFLLDHISPEFFFNLIDEGQAPNVSKYILGSKLNNNTYSNATICRNVITGFPSTSANTHTSILTGSYAGKNDLVLGNYWNLKGNKAKFINTDKIGLNSIKTFNYEYINTECKTLFEYINDSASFHAVNRGAEFKLFTTKTLLTKFAPLLIKMSKKDEPGAVSPMARPELWINLFTKEVGKFLKKVKEDNHLYRALFFVFLLTDENAHKFGFESEQFRKAVNVLDYCVEKLIEGLPDERGEHIPGLKELGYLDKIVWNINTDHAGREVFLDKMIAVDAITQFDLGLKFIEGTLEKDGEGNPKNEINGYYSEINAYTMVSSEIFNGWFAQDAAATQDFTGFYGEKLFRNLIPMNKEVKNRDSNVDLIEYYINKEYCQFVIIPEEDPILLDYGIYNTDRIAQKIPRDYSIKIFSKDGVGKITRKLIKDSIHYNYEIIDGRDPLNYENVGLSYNEFHNQEKWLKKTINHDLPDVFHRLYGFFNAKFAPNFIITSELKYHFYSEHALMHKVFKYKQNHDGLYSVESKVPLTFAGAGVKNGSEIPYARNIDILPTLLKIMDVPFDDEKIDGNPLEDVLK